MNLNIKRHNFTNQSSILLKKIDDVSRANSHDTLIIKIIRSNQLTRRAITAVYNNIK